MGFKLAELFVEIGARDGPLNRTLTGVRGKLAALARTKFNIPGGGFAAILGGVGVAAALRSAVMGASDLGETMSKVNFVFGDSATKVTELSDTLAKDFGLNKKTILDAAAAIGLIGKGSGQSQSEAAGLGTQMAKLAADASSFYNVPLDEALEKIRAGLVGESEPLRAFGVLLSEDAVKLEAYSTGIAKAGAKLTEAQKVQARSTLIARGLKDATGDLERTSSSTSNQMKKFSGNMENLAATVGSILLPPINSLLAILNEMATDGANAFASFSATGTGAMATVSGAIDAVGVVYRNIGDIFERTSVTIAKSFAIVGGTAAAFVSYLQGNWFTIFGDVFNAATEVVSNAAANIQTIFGELKDFLASGFTDPIEIKLKPLLEGFKAVGPAFKPQLDLGDFDRKIKEIDDRMAAKAAAHMGGEAGANAGAPAAGAAAMAARKYKADIVDASSYSDQIQKAALEGKDKVPEQQLGKLASIDKGIQDLAAAMKKGPPATAVFA